MDASWFLLVLSVAILVSMVLLVVVCLDCWNKGPLVSIRQTNASEEYMQSTEFRVIHPLHPGSDLNSIRSGPHLLSPPRVLSSSTDSGTQRRHQSFTQTETESNPSYENPVEGPEYANPDPNCHDSDVEEPGYIIVIPDGEALAPSSISRASTPSSDVRHEYVNLEEEKEKEEEEEQEEEEDDLDYQNVDPKNSLTHSLTAALCRSRPTSREEGPNLNDATSESSALSETDDDDDDDDEGNYVNQPPLIHSQLRA
ncbi:linker for activation of T-cells family member 1-like isoform X1 [Seriola aureovittata]|uniref:linker for activation of T-cells family member 1-like isoform X1 n=1 Tax=Seriola aureovittata TaxID=2871759 RepID=UPI0024BF1059|nr:linker for activation of T-cells family member 1-like isoform X1 [Seriola aureovittata]